MQRKMLLNLKYKIQAFDNYSNITQNTKNHLKKGNHYIFLVWKMAALKILLNLL